MSRFSWIPGAKRRKPVQLSEYQLQRLHALPEPQGWDEQPLDRQRLVVVDLETTGLDIKRDQVLAIGAVVIENGCIDLGQQFEATLKSQGRPLKDSVLIHELAPSTLSTGSDPAEALLAFMEFVAASPLLAFHAPFDQGMLERALLSQLDHRLQHGFIDVAELAPMLNTEARATHKRLDDWIGHFSLGASQRHHAAADALVTAELALILFSQAKRQGLDSPQALVRALQRWRRDMFSF